MRVALARYAGNDATASEMPKSEYMNEFFMNFFFTMDYIYCGRALSPSYLEARAGAKSHMQKQRYSTRAFVLLGINYLRSGYQTKPKVKQNEHTTNW